MEGARLTVKDVIRLANSVASKPDYRNTLLARAAQGLAQTGDVEGGMRIATELPSDSRASVMGNIALAQFEAGDEEGARRLTANALAVAETLTDNKKRAEALYATVAATFKIDGVEASLRLANRITNRDFRNYSFSTIAWYQAEGGDIDGALNTIGRAEEKSRIHTLAFIAGQLAKAGDAQGARRNMEAAVRFARNQSDGYFGGAPALATIVGNQAKMGDMTGARRTVDIMLSVIGSLEQDRRDGARAYLAGAHVWLGDVEGAFDAAHSHSDENSRNSALSSIAIAQAKTGAVEEGRRTANRITDDTTRHYALVGIARHLLEEKRQK
ncbi:MAG: hypothetical protein ISR44_11375 [Rhodospirillales bacterium]|nr:hypothetical protein [Rhodospirillales bacterium]